MKINGYKLSLSSSILMAITIINPISVCADPNKEYKDSVPPSRHGKTYTTKTTSGGLKKTGMAIHNDNLWVWGARNHGLGGNDDKNDTKEPPQIVESLKQVVRTAGGIDHFMALEESGDLYSWGRNEEKQVGCGMKPGFFATPCKLLENVIYMDASQHMSIAVTEEGDVYTWGDATYGASDNKKDQPVPLKVTHKLNSEKARLVGSSWQGFFAITVDSAGKHSVWAWGDNEGAALALPTTKSPGHRDVRKEPVRVAALDSYAEHIVYIAGGRSWGEALLDDGTVIGWGGERGLGMCQKKPRPFSHIPVEITKNVERLYARYNGSVALTYDGKILVWGVKRGHTSDMVTPLCLTTPVIFGRAINIGGGLEHDYYINHRGELYGVGYNSRGQAGPRHKNSNPDWPGAVIPIEDWEQGKDLDFL